MKIRKLCYDDLKEASDVLWKSFYEAEKHNSSMAGMERFRDLTSPISLSMNTYDGKIVLYGGFHQGKMVVVGALKEENCILMLYVLPAYWRRGFGNAMLLFLEKESASDTIKLNASDFAVPFYRNRGYHIIQARREENDLIFTPMEKIKETE